MSEYWGRVHRRAVREAARSLGLDSREQIVIKAVVTVAVIGVLSYWGSEDAPFDEILSFGARLAVLVLLILPAIYLWKFVKIPPKMEQEAKEEFSEELNFLNQRMTILESEREQILSFEFRGEDNKFLETVPFQEGENLVGYKVGRVAVKNLSHTTMVRNLRVKLVHYWEDGGPIFQTVDILLRSYSSGDTVEDVGARGNVTCDLFRVPQGENTTHIDLGPYPNGNYKQIPTGKYRLKITASSADTPSISQFFLLHVKENGEIIYRRWIEAESLHVRTRLA